MCVGREVVKEEVVGGEDRDKEGCGLVFGERLERGNKGMLEEDLVCRGVKCLKWGRRRVKGEV